jgi:hypothetical protein
MPWLKILTWVFCLSLTAGFFSVTACGGTEDEADDEDDESDDDTEPEEATSQDCFEAMLRLFGEDGCANPTEAPLYSDEEIQGSCDQDFEVAAQSECHNAAYASVVACMEQIDCVDANGSQLAWTNCRIDFGDAINICDCPPDGIC